MIDLQLLKEEKEMKAYVNNFRKEHIPEQYNQIKLCNELTNDNLDHFISISNRTDGKTINYLHFFMNLSIDFDLGFMLIGRHFTIRDEYQEIVEKVMDLSTVLDSRNLHFVRRQFYIKVLYENKTIGIITDLDQATDLKYASNYIKDFPIMIYDEFLAIEGDYLPDEWVRLKTIYNSLDRKGHRIPYIHSPIIFYLGNAVNFSSPVLARLNLFNALESQKMGTVRIHKNKIIELNRNDKANETRNLRAFDEENDNMTTGEFYINKHNIATENDRRRITKNSLDTFVKLRNEYLKITFNIDTLESLLSIVADSEYYDFNMFIKDNNEKSLFLKDTFYDIEHINRYNRNIFLFDNMYSKDFILQDFTGLKDLRIHAVVRKHLSRLGTIPNNEIKEIQYEESYIQATKRGLVNKFYG